MATETVPAPPRLAGDGTGRADTAALLERAQDALAFERERADRAEAELAAVIDSTGELVAAAGRALRERAEAAEAEAARLRAGLAERGTPRPVVPAAGYLTPAVAAAALGLKPAALRYLDGKGTLTSVRTLGGQRRYLAAGVRALRASLDAAGVPPEGLLSCAGAAAVLGVSPQSVARRAAAGHLELVRVPGCRAGFRPGDVRALLAGGGEGGHG